MSISPSPATVLTGRRVLVVEDEAMVAMLLEDLLGALELDVAGVASSVPQALAMLAPAGALFDVALLDLNLRGAPGYPVADRLAALGIPFVFCSGYGEAGLADGYRHVPVVSKPFDLHVLAEVLAAQIKSAYP